MQFTVPPEMTTAITDVMIGILAVFLYFRIRNQSNDFASKKIWLWVFLFLSAASFYGGILHGIVIEKQLLTMLWHPLAFLLGMMVSLFVAGIVVDWKGKTAAKLSLQIMISLGILFFVAMFTISHFIKGYFVIFIVYSSLTMLFSLIVSILIGYQRREESAYFFAVGIFLIIFGSVLQAMRSIHFTLIWEFDFNSVYHFFVMAAAVLMYLGIQKKEIKI